MLPYGNCKLFIVLYNLPLLRQPARYNNLAARVICSIARLFAALVAHSLFVFGVGVNLVEYKTDSLAVQASFF